MIRELTEMTMGGERFSRQMRSAFFDLGPIPLKLDEEIDGVHLMEEPDTNCFRLTAELVQIDRSKEAAYTDIPISTATFKPEEKSAGEKLAGLMNEPAALQRANRVLERSKKIHNRMVQTGAALGIVAAGQVVGRLF